MDPGTVLGVVSLGLQVCNGLLGYFQDWKACPKEVQELCQSLQSTEKTLNLIHDIGRRLPDEPAAVRIEASLHRCRGIFEELQKELKELNKNHDHDSNSTKRFRFRVKSQWIRANYPRKKDTIQNLLKLLHEQKDNLVLLLGILQM
jgi:ankyrin repeat domain-containing protein 50